MPKTNTGIRPVLTLKQVQGIQEQPHPWNLTMQQKQIIRRK